VKLGRGGSRVEVLEGLEPGERVIVRGNERLRDGQPVRVTGGR
jgi:multidrug efflux pump subunit AcrA (membrane-fusion protein)